MKSEPTITQLLICTTCGFVCRPGAFGPHVRQTLHQRFEIYVAFTLVCTTCGQDIDASNALVHEFETGHTHWRVRLEDGSTREIAG